MKKYEVTINYYNRSPVNWGFRYNGVQNALDQAREWAKEDDTLKSVEFKRDDFTLIYKRS